MSNALVVKFAERFSVAEADVLGTLKSTCFKGQVSDAQMTALMIVADQYGLNPFTKEIYAFPDKNNGIVPVVGVDGWSRIINEHPQFDGMDFNDDGDSIECVIYRKDRSHPIKTREYMTECKRSTQPWQSHPRRMLRHKALIQCARLAFGYVGIFDQDEAERIIEAPARIDKSPQGAAANNAPNGYSEYESEHLQAMRDAALNGMSALESAFAALPKSQHKAAFWQAHRADLHSSAQSATVIDAETGEVV